MRLTANHSTPRHPILSSLALLIGVLIATAAGAAGFGELTLHSRIGENLRAEVPLIGISKETADPSCYTLAPNPGSDLPVITKARIQIIRNNNNYRMLIIGDKPIGEPVFSISLRAKCGIDLRHDYTLMPDAPLPVAETTANAKRPVAQDISTTPPPTGKKKRRVRASQRRAVKADAQETPEPAPSHFSQELTPRQPDDMASTGSGNRLRLSAAPLELNPGDMAAPAYTAEMEQRLLKMDTSLSTLNQGIDALDTSLKLSREMLSARNDLQTAQNLPQGALSAATLNPDKLASNDASFGDWLELAFSAMLGGSIVVGLATFLGRNKQGTRPSI